jgi:hypothetical protein
MKKRWKSNFSLGRKLQKIFRCMKLTFLLLTCFVVQAFASLNAQTVTIKKQNASLEEVIWELNPVHLHVQQRRHRPNKRD